MNGKIILAGTIGIIGVGGLLYKTINNQLDKIYIKRESEIREIEKKWFNDGWDAGYENGKRDAELESMIKTARYKNEV